MNSKLGSGPWSTLLAVVLGDRVREERHEGMFLSPESGVGAFLVHLFEIHTHHDNGLGHEILATHPTPCQLPQVPDPSCPHCS